MSRRRRPVPLTTPPWEPQPYRKRAPLGYVTSIEKDGTVSSLGKLVVEWLARRDPRPFKASEVGPALGVYGSYVAEEAHQLRRKGLLERMSGEKPLALGDLVLSSAARDAYAPPASSAQKQSATKGKT